MHGYICPECGAYLDPGERCDCRAKEEQEAKRQAEELNALGKYFIREEDGQLKIAV